MTWTTVVMVIVLPMVIRGCEVTTLGSYLQKPLKKNGDLWTVSVDVKLNHDDDWQLGLFLIVIEDTQATSVMKLTLNHMSDHRLIRLHGHFGKGEITGDGFLPMPKNQSFTLAATICRYDLELQISHEKKTATHGIGNFDGITTSTLELTNIVAAENFNVSHGCVEDNNSRTSKILKYAVQTRFSGTATTLDYSAHTTLPGTENKTAVIAVASCTAIVLVLGVIFLISRRLLTCSQTSKHCTVPPAVFYVVQSPERVHCSLLHLQQESVDEPPLTDGRDSDSSVDSPRLDPTSSLCRNTRGREGVAGDGVSGRPGEPLQRKLSSHVYESITDLDCSVDGHSSSNSTYEPFCA